MSFEVGDKVVLSAVGKKALAEGQLQGYPTGVGEVLRVRESTDSFTVRIPGIKVDDLNGFIRNPGDVIVYGDEIELAPEAEPVTQQAAMLAWLTDFREQNDPSRDEEEMAIEAFEAGWDARDSA